MKRVNMGSPIGGLITTKLAANFSSMNNSGRRANKWRRTILWNLIIGVVVSFPVVVIAAQPIWRGITPEPVNGNAKGHLSFQCPRAFLGIKGNMLPTHWQADDRGRGLQLGYASINGAYMICSYRSPKNRKQRFGPVRRLIPRGYRCISDGISSFRCQKK